MQVKQKKHRSELGTPQSQRMTLEGRDDLPGPHLWHPRWFTGHWRPRCLLQLKANDSKWSRNATKLQCTTAGSGETKALVFCRSDLVGTKHAQRLQKQAITAMNLPWYWYASKLPRQIEIRPMMSNRQTIAKRTKSLHAYRSLELHHLALNLLTSCRKPLSGGSHTGLLVFVWYLGKGMQGIKLLLYCSEDASILPRFQYVPKTRSKGVFKKVFGDLWSTKYCLICHFGRPCLLKYELYLNIFI